MKKFFVFIFLPEKSLLYDDKCLVLVGISILQIGCELISGDY